MQQSSCIFHISWHTIWPDSSLGSPSRAGSLAPLGHFNARTWNMQSSCGSGTITPTWPHVLSPSFLSLSVKLTAVLLAVPLHHNAAMPCDQGAACCHATKLRRRHTTAYHVSAHSPAQGGECGMMIRCRCIESRMRTCRRGGTWFGSTLSPQGSARNAASLPLAHGRADALLFVCSYCRCTLPPSLADARES
jgi:hypothetical protein